MTDRSEIEHLLNQTGRTLKGLPKLPEYRGRGLANTKKAMGESGITETIPFMVYQADVIELLIGALRDALDKPIQKPLTELELRILMSADEDVVIYFESKNDDHAYATILFNGNNIDRDGDVFENADLFWPSYGVDWRAWASKPTDEEREAAAWES